MGSVIPSARVLCSFSVKSTAYKNTSLSEASVWTSGVAVCRNCGTEGEGSAGCGIQRDPEGACWQLVGVPLGLGLGCKKCVVCCQPKKVNRFQYNISWQWPTLSEEARAQASKYVDAHRTHKCAYSSGQPFQKSTCSGLGKRIPNPSAAQVHAPSWHQKESGHALTHITGWCESQWGADG